MYTDVIRSNVYVSHWTLFCIDFFFFFNDTATTEIYTLSLHDALPISPASFGKSPRAKIPSPRLDVPPDSSPLGRSEEHTSELQSQSNLVCRLLLEKKKKTITLAIYAILTELEMQ